MKIHNFLYLKITSSDFKSEAGKAIASAETKTGNLIISASFLLFLHEWMAPVLLH